MNGISRRAVVGSLLLASVTLATGGGPARAQGSLIRSIRAAGPAIEVEVHSSTPFPVRALPPVLRIGGREFRLSRSPADGSLSTLIFLLTPEEFARVSTGDQVTVHYGGAETPHGGAVGRLDKSLLGR